MPLFLALERVCAQPEHNVGTTKVTVREYLEAVQEPLGEFDGMLNMLENCTCESTL